ADLRRLRARGGAPAPRPKARLRGAAVAPARPAEWTGGRGVDVGDRRAGRAALAGGGHAVRLPRAAPAGWACPPGLLPRAVPVEPGDHAAGDRGPPARRGRPALRCGAARG